MNRLTLLLVTLLSACSTFEPVCHEPSPTDALPYESPEARDARMGWWRDARFGMFIHWGLYAIPAGAWEKRTNHGEWIRTTAQIPIDTYDHFRREFNPTQFNATAWAAVAREAGMRYVTITTKHHDGFCLFDSDHTDFDVMNTPFRRDIMSELSDAVRNEGLAMCWYHSIMDWHHPDYLPRREWEKNRPTESADMNRYVAYLRSQVTELLTRYGTIGAMWFDGEWESTWNHERGQSLYNLCRRLQPNVLVNNRVDVGRGGMAGQTRDGIFAGDYGTPEQEVPATGLPGVDWETCMTMGGHWGWNSAETQWKSTEVLIKTLCDVASKGGNFLLNVGPKADGTFPDTALDRLKGIGAWMKVNADSIHGTQASLIGSLPFGRSTTRHHKDGSITIYLQVFDLPMDGILEVPTLGDAPLKSEVLGIGTVKVEHSKRGTRLAVRAPTAPSAIPVIALHYPKTPTIFRDPTIDGGADIFINSTVITIPEVPGVDLRVTFDGREPSAEGIVGPGSYRLTESRLVSVQGFLRGSPVTDRVTRRFTQVTPNPAVEIIVGPRDDVELLFNAGLLLESWKGSWKRLPDFESLGVAHARSFVTMPLHASPAEENIGRRYTGYISIPEDAVYTFELTCDDGGVLDIDGQVVIDHDGLHQATPKTCQVALAKGRHSVEIRYFNATGGEWLDVKWARSGETLQRVPASAWSYLKGS